VENRDRGILIGYRPHYLCSAIARIRCPVMRIYIELCYVQPFYPDENHFHIYIYDAPPKLCQKDKIKQKMTFCLGRNGVTPPPPVLSK
jgi:hypothetical protein